MMIATKTAGCQKTKTTKTDLVCVCGKRLSVSIKSEGWFDALTAVASANQWKVEDHFDFRLSEETPAYCPYCHKP